jgi:hypothetical protein
VLGLKTSVINKPPLQLTGNNWSRGIKKSETPRDSRQIPALQGFQGSKTNNGKKNNQIILLSLSSSLFPSWAFPTVLDVNNIIVFDFAEMY